MQETVATAKHGYSIGTGSSTVNKIVRFVFPIHFACFCIYTMQVIIVTSYHNIVVFPSAFHQFAEPIIWFSHSYSHFFLLNLNRVPATFHPDFQYKLYCSRISAGASIEFPVSNFQRIFHLYRDNKPTIG